MRIGATVARFQTHRLHLGHTTLIEWMVECNEVVIIFLGCGPLLSTKRNPLDFYNRAMMITAKYPTVIILPLYDNKSDNVWSEMLDKKLEPWDTKDNVITLYGSRDSFIPSYSGKHYTVTIPRVKNVPSSTIIRKGIVSSQPPSTEEFRKGIIYGSHQSYPTSYQAVDAAIINNDNGWILLGRKKDEYLWRFPGGFVDPADESLEAAAKREATEECGDIELGVPKYITSMRVDDWRYRKEEDKLMTTLFRIPFVFGNPKASDDLAEVSWFDLSCSPLALVPEHEKLMEILLQHEQYHS